MYQTRGVIAIGRTHEIWAKTGEDAIAEARRISSKEIGYKVPKWDSIFAAPDIQNTVGNTEQIYNDRLMWHKDAILATVLYIADTPIKSNNN
jgi:hypothetical protein